MILVEFCWCLDWYLSFRIWFVVVTLFYIFLMKKERDISYNECSTRKRKKAETAVKTLAETEKQKKWRRGVLLGYPVQFSWHHCLYDQSSISVWLSISAKIQANDRHCFALFLLQLLDSYINSWNHTWLISKASCNRKQNTSEFLSSWSFNRIKWISNNVWKQDE